MKPFYLFLVLFSTSLTATLSAQEVIPSPGSRRPVLVDDVHANALRNLRTNDTTQALSPDQQRQIQAFETEMKKQLLQLNNALAEKQARLHTLETADKTDMKAINSTIDDIAKLIADKMKTRAAYKQKVRAILRDEQRLDFDTRRQVQFPAYSF